MSSSKAKLSMRAFEGNKTEAAFAETLYVRAKDGEIQWFAFEPMRLRLAKGAMYTPDFGVLENDGSFTFYEVKGFWREAAKVRIKVARGLYPFFRFVVVRKGKGGWEYEEV